MVWISVKSFQAKRIERRERRECIGCRVVRHTPFIGADPEELSREDAQLSCWSSKVYLHATHKRTLTEPTKEP